MPAGWLALVACWPVVVLLSPAGTSLAYVGAGFISIEASVAVEDSPMVFLTFLVAVTVCHIWWRLTCSSSRFILRCVSSFMV